MQSNTATLMDTRIRRARRDDVIEAAIAVIDRDGFATAWLERIAAEAGTSKGTVLYHFGSKEAVYQAVIDALFAHGTAEMTERIMAAAGHRARLHVYLDSNLRFIAENARHVSAVHAILDHAAGDASDETAVPGLVRLLSAGQRDGEFGEFDPQVVALVIRAVVDAAARYFTTSPGIDLDHHIAEAIRLFDKATA